MNMLVPSDVTHAHATIVPNAMVRAIKTLAPVPEGETLQETVDRAVREGWLTKAEAASPHLVITVHGCEYTRAQWRWIRPKKGMYVLVRIRLSGGGSGKKNPLRTILSLLVVVAVAAISGGALGPTAASATGLLGPAFAAGQIGAVLGAAVASVALNALVNAIAPIPQPQLGSRSQSYTLSGSRNTMDPYGACVMTLGKMRVTPKLAARPFTRIYADQTVLYMLFQWHVGKCELSEIKIGDTPISDFDDVTIEHRLLGEAYGSAITLIPNLVIENPDIQIEVKQADGWQTRTFPKQCFRVSFDIAFPGGLFESKDGSNKAKSVSFSVQYRAVGASTWINVPMTASPHMPVAGTFTLNVNNPDSIRRTVEWEPPAGVGDYEMQLRRTTADTSSTSVSDEAYWMGVRGDRYGQPVLDDDLCITAVRIVASGQLNNVIDQLNGICEPIIPIYSGGNWSTEAKSRNPAAIYRWLHTGPGIAEAMRLTDARLDNDALNYWHGYCVTKSLTCDHVLDYDASVDEAAQLAAACGNASAAWALGKRTAIIDDTKVPTQLFTSETVRGFRGKIIYLEEVHALRCAFTNAAAGYKPDEVIVYADGYDSSTATKFQQAEIPGKTLAADVWKAGRRLLKRAQYRRVGYEFEIDTECLVSRYGDRVLLEHFALHKEAMSARVEAIAGTSGSVVGVTLSETVTMEYGTVYALQVRRGSDGVLPLLDVTNPASPGVPVTTATLGFTGTVLLAYEPAAGDLVVWGKKTAMTTDVSIINLAPASDDFTASVIAVPYNADLFADDGTTAPAHQTYVNAGQSQGLVLNPVLPFDAIMARIQGAILEASAAAGDGILTPAEKVGLVPQLKNLTNTQAALDARATALAITTEKTAFDGAMTTLNAYLATLTTPVAWDSQSGNTTVDGPTLITNYRNALEKQIALQDAIDREASRAVGVQLLRNPTGRQGIYPWVNAVLSGVSRYGDAFANLGYWAKSSPSAFDSFHAQSVDVQAGQTYSFRSVIFLSGRSAGNCRVYADWLNAGGTTISYAGIGTTRSADGEFIEAFPNCVAPTSAVKLRIVLNCNGLTASLVAFKENKIERGEVCTPYNEALDAGITSATDAMYHNYVIVPSTDIYTPDGVAAGIDGQGIGATSNDLNDLDATAAAKLNAAALRATASPTTRSGSRLGVGNITTGSVTVSAVNAVGSISYLWEQLNGEGTISFSASTSATTTFTKAVKIGENQTCTVRCTITDATTSAKATVEVPVTFVETT